MVNGWLEDKEQRFFYIGIRTLEKHLTKSISVKGGYVEKRQHIMCVSPLVVNCISLRTFWTPLIHISNKEHKNLGNQSFVTGFQTRMHVMKKHQFIYRMDHKLLTSSSAIFYTITHATLCFDVLMFLFQRYKLKLFAPAQIIARTSLSVPCKTQGIGCHCLIYAVSCHEVSQQNAYMTWATMPFTANYHFTDVVNFWTS